MSTGSIRDLVDPEPVIHPLSRSPGHRYLEELCSKTLEFPAELTVPIIDQLQPLHSRPGSASSSASSSYSSSSTYSTDSDGRAKNADSLPLMWNDADLNYLLSILLPHLVFAKQLTLIPQLSIVKQYGTFSLQLYSGSTLLAESGRCTSPSGARRALACMLLRDRQGVNELCANHNVTGSLFSMGERQLSSILRAMQFLARIDAKERAGRILQLKDVNEEYDIEPRLEAFLLGPGHKELEGWTRCVEYALELEEGVRKGLGDTYGDAGRFLRRAVASQST